jgi:hypothetical protein
VGYQVGNGSRRPPGAVASLIVARNAPALAGVPGEHRSAPSLAGADRRYTSLRQL